MECFPEVGNLAAVLLRKRGEKAFQFWSIMEIMPSIPKPFYITRKLTTSKHLNMFYVPSAPVFLLPGTVAKHYDL